MREIRVADPGEGLKRAAGLSDKARGLFVFSGTGAQPSVVLPWSSGGGGLVLHAVFVESRQVPEVTVFDRAPFGFVPHQLADLGQ